MAYLRTALAQIDTSVGDLDKNSAKVVELARRAAEQGARLVVFPEMTLTGYPIEDLALRASFQRAAANAARVLATTLAEQGLGDLTVIIGSVGTHGRERPAPAPTVPDGGVEGTATPLGTTRALPVDLTHAERPTNRAMVLQGGRVVAQYDKHHLPNYGVFDEFRIFAPGDATCVLTLDGTRVGVVICEDIWQEGGPVARLADEGVDLLVVLNGSPYEEGKGHLRTDLAARRAAQVGAPLVYVNMVGGQDDLVFDGGSFVADASGVLASAPQFVEHLLVWDLEPAPEGAAATPPRRAEVAPPLDPDEEVYRALVLGLTDYVRKNGFRSVVLGLSGGIDSALVAAIAADAIGGENVVGVSMPSSYSSEHSRDDAADTAQRLGAEYRVQPIAPMMDAFQAELGFDGIAAENLQARIRGVILMGLSNAEGHLTLATGNKSELAVGYSTIYGDAVGGYAPLKDVYKSRVWALARWRNNLALDRGEIPPIPESSITKPPSAELRPGQVDQDSLPSYDLLDRVLDAYIEDVEGRAELLARGFDADVVDLVVSLVDRAEWKRRQYPLGPKVTPVAFGRDRRLPITNRWREPLP